MVGYTGFRCLTGSIRSDDFYLVSDPIGRKVYSAAVSTGFYPLFEHFFAVNFEFDFAVGNIGGEFFLISGILNAVLIFIIWHLGLPLCEIKIELILAAGCCKPTFYKLRYSYIVSESREKEVLRFRL